MASITGSSSKSGNNSSHTNNSGRGVPGPGVTGASTGIRSKGEKESLICAGKKKAATVTSDSEKDAKISLSVCILLQGTHSEKEKEDELMEDEAPKTKKGKKKSRKKKSWKPLLKELNLLPKFFHPPPKETKKVIIQYNYQQVSLSFTALC